MKTIQRKPTIETPEERDLRLKSYALLSKLKPLLGKFYASPDLCVEIIEKSLSPLNINKMNAAFNKLNKGGELEDKEKLLITNITKACLLFSLKDLQAFMGDEQFKAVIQLIVQKFVDSYDGANFKIPEEIKIKTLEEVKEDDAKKKEKEKKKEEEDASGDDDSEEDDSNSDDVGDDGEDDESSEEDGEEGEDDEALESESASKETEIRYMDSTAFIVMDLIKFMKKLRWEDICKRLVQIKETPSFESKSAEEIINRLTFRVPASMRSLAKDLVYKYEIVLGGKPIGLIHSLNESGNRHKARQWRVSIRNHFQDANYRSGFSNDEPFTVVRGENIVLHNVQPMTMDEARAWVRTVVEK